MLHWSQVYQQLKKRRVIRAILVYLALFWLALQVADLLVESNLADEQQVRWLIIGGLALFPLVLIASWFVEHPWHERAWIALLGDLALILTVAVASSLLAWQQWSKFSERPVVAILGFTQTDTRDSTRAMANHLDKRLNMLFGAVPDILVLDLESTRHPELQALPVADKARLLGADYVLTGTINQSNLKLRFNVQLFDADGELLWSDRFGDRIIDQFQLQSSVIAAAWPRLGLRESGLVPVTEILQSCEYPSNREAILELVSVEQQLDDLGQPDRARLEALIDTLDRLLVNLDEAGLAFLARARVREKLLQVTEPTRLAVQYQLLNKDLEEARFHCPAHPDIEMMRLLQLRELESGDDPAPLLARYPNSFPLRNRLAHIYRDPSTPNKALDFSAAALQLNPLNVESWCLYRAALLDNPNASGEDTVAEWNERSAGIGVNIDCEQGNEY